MPTIDGPVTDPRTIRPDLNPDLAGFLIKACAPASADRFSTAAEMQLTLRNIRTGLLSGGLPLPQATRRVHPPRRETRMKHRDPFFTEAKYVGAFHEIGAAEPV